MDASPSAPPQIFHLRQRLHYNHLKVIQQCHLKVCCAHLRPNTEETSPRWYCFTLLLSLGIISASKSMLTNLLPYQCFLLQR